MIATTEWVTWLLCVLIIVGIAAEILWSTLIRVVIPWYRIRKLKKYAEPVILDKYERPRSMRAYSQQKWWKEEEKKE